MNSGDKQYWFTHLSFPGPRVSYQQPTVKVIFSEWLLLVTSEVNLTPLQGVCGSQNFSRLHLCSHLLPSLSTLWPWVPKSTSLTVPNLSLLLSIVANDDIVLYSTVLGRETLSQAKNTCKEMDWKHQARTLTGRDRDQKIQRVCASVSSLPDGDKIPVMMFRIKDVCQELLRIMLHKRAFHTYQKHNIFWEIVKF